MLSYEPEMVANSNPPPPQKKKNLSFCIPYCTHTARNKATDIRIIAKLCTKVHDPMFDIHFNER
jgi:hypothetical protein